MHVNIGIPDIIKRFVSNFRLNLFRACISFSKNPESNICGFACKHNI